MPKFSKENGLPICDELIALIRKSVSREGCNRKLALILGCHPSNIGNWLGDTTVAISTISWDIWEKFREYLYAHGDIDIHNPKWMLPSEMREALLNSSNNNSSNNKVTLQLSQEPLEQMQEVKILDLSRQLNHAGKEAVIGMMQGLATQSNFSKDQRQFTMEEGMEKLG